MPSPPNAQTGDSATVIGIRKVKECLVRLAIRECMSDGSRAFRRLQLAVLVQGVFGREAAISTARFQCSGATRRTVATALECLALFGGTVDI